MGPRDSGAAAGRAQGRHRRDRRGAKISDRNGGAERRPARGPGERLARGVQGHRRQDAARSDRLGLARGSSARRRSLDRSSAATGWFGTGRPRLGPAMIRTKVSPRNHKRGVGRWSAQPAKQSQMPQFRTTRGAAGGSPAWTERSAKGDTRPGMAGCQITLTEPCAAT